MTRMSVRRSLLLLCSILVAGCHSETVGDHPSSRSPRPTTLLNQEATLRSPDGHFAGLSTPPHTSLESQLAAQGYKPATGHGESSSVWPIDGENKYDGNFEHIFAKLGNKPGPSAVPPYEGTFQDLVDSRKANHESTHILDLFGSGLFLNSREKADSVTGLRWEPLDRAESQRRKNSDDVRAVRDVDRAPEQILGDIFHHETWRALDLSMSERKIPAFDLVVMRPLGAWTCISAQSAPPYCRKGNNAPALALVINRVLDRLAPTGRFYFAVGTADDPEFVKQAPFANLAARIEKDTPFRLVLARSGTGLTLFEGAILPKAKAANVALDGEPPSDTDGLFTGMASPGYVSLESELGWRGYIPREGHGPKKVIAQPRDMHDGADDYERVLKETKEPPTKRGTVAEAYKGFFDQFLRERKHAGGSAHVLVINGWGQFFERHDIADSLTTVNWDSIDWSRLYADLYGNAPGLPDAGLQVPREVLGDLFNHRTWETLDVQMAERGISKFDLIVLPLSSEWRYSAAGLTGKFAAPGNNALSIAILLNRALKRLSPTGRIYFSFVVRGDRDLAHQSWLNSLSERVKRETNYRMVILQDDHEVMGAVLPASSKMSGHPTDF